MVASKETLPETIATYLRRYRLATAEILAAQRVAGLRDETDARELLDCLASNGLLECAPLVPGESNETYFYASARIATQLGDPSLAERHRSLDERLALWAVARFCSGENPFRELLTREEFRTQFAELWKPGEPLRYYLEPTGDVTRLAFIKVDLGGASHWDRVVDSCCRFIKKRIEPSCDSADSLRSDLFRQLIDHGRFQVSVLLATPEKAEAINARLDIDAVRYGERPPIVPYVVPGLLQLLLRSSFNDRTVYRAAFRNRRPSAA